MIHACSSMSHGGYSDEASWMGWNVCVLEDAVHTPHNLDTLSLVSGHGAAPGEVQLIQVQLMSGKTR